MSPKGARSKRPPPASPRQRVFIIRPATQSPENRQLLAAAKKQADALGIAPTVYIAQRLTFRGESPETAGEVLAASDAAALYRAAHRDYVLVMAGGQFQVVRDPSSEPPTRRGTIELRQYVAHKALFSSIESRADITAALDKMQAWPASLGCVNESDPRALPLHVFQTVRDWSRLGDPAVTRRFARRYGPGSRRVDDGGKLWQRTKEYHGAAPIHVGGTRLEDGMHWDVRSASVDASLHTANEVWSLGGKCGYVNVYPDAQVLRAQGRSTAKRVWPR